MSLPREPRQKMINMMYLVLTALLALNVSSEILNAFKTVNNSLEKSNSVVDASTVNIMKSLQLAMDNPTTADLAKIWYPKAQLVQNYSTAVFNNIQTYKNQILTKAGGDPKDPTKSYKEDNLDIATRMFVDKGEGKKLLAMLTQYEKDVLNVDSSINTEFSKSLPINLDKPKTQNKSNKTWESAYFHMVPTVAALTILSKFQNDVKNAENKVIAFCHKKVGEVQIHQESMAAMALANSTNLLPGQELEIQAGVGGFSKTASPIITIGGARVDVDENGVAHQKITASGLGSHTVPVHIIYTDEKGQQKTFDQNIQYSVGQSNAAVQLDKMNVLFIGVDNPITVSGSGSADLLKVNISGGGGALTRTTTGYTVRVNQETDNCIISITTPDGKTTPVPFRVRSIPDPTPRVGAVEFGDIQAAVFKSQAGVNAIVKNFFYATQFNVTGFRIVGDGDGFDSPEEKINTGAAWNEAQSILKKCKQGSIISIDDVRAIGPDNRTRKLTPMIFYLK